MSLQISNFAGDHTYNDGQPRRAFDQLVLRRIDAADGYTGEQSLVLVRGAGHPDQVLIGGERYRFYAVLAAGPGAGNALYGRESGSQRRVELLSAQGFWRDNQGVRQRTACHFFEPAQRQNPLPLALCGWQPDDPALSPESYTTADYTPSAADCRDCQVVLGELKPRRR